MTKILATIGPESCKTSDIIKISNFTNTLRLNLSHSNLGWHKKICDRIKKINRNITILVDLPGIKPRTKNQKIISIKKNQKIFFSSSEKIYSRKFQNIFLTNKIPEIKKKIKHFSLSDGKYIFKIIKKSNKYILGVSTLNFKLYPKQGFNIPESFYNSEEQFKLYKKTIKAIKHLKYDAVGLSYIQDTKIIKKIKNIIPDKIIVSKIENSLGYKNSSSIIKLSEAIMLDRGDLYAEIGPQKFFKAIEDISIETKKNRKILIMATENLETMMSTNVPTKNDIIALGHSKKLNVDMIMLSAETAMNKGYLSILKWLSNYLKEKKIKEKKYLKHDLFWDTVSKLDNFPLVIFSKKGFALNYLTNITNIQKVFLFTANKKIHLLNNMKSNIKSFLLDNFGKKDNNSIIIKQLSKYKNSIFENSDFAYIISIFNPKHGSRANSITFIAKKDLK